MINLRKRLPFWQRLIIVFTTMLAVTAGLHLYRRHQLQTAPPVPQTAVVYSTPDQAAQPAPSLLIKIPFTPQAPTANWDELHNEGCEEASSIMAHAYFSGIKTKVGETLPPEQVEQEIAKLTKWQDEHQGYHLDQTALETAKMIESVYQLHTEIIPLNQTDGQDQIKQVLTANKLIIISFNGRELHNPHYKQPGPIHHMLVLTGWTEDGKIITQDSGTKFGENYQYDFSTLYNAAADWDHSIESVDNTKKFAIIVSK